MKYLLVCTINTSEVNINSCGHNNSRLLLSSVQHRPLWCYVTVGLTAGLLSRSALEEDTKLKWADLSVPPGRPIRQEESTAQRWEELRVRWPAITQTGLPSTQPWRPFGDGCSVEWLRGVGEVTWADELLQTAAALPSSWGSEQQTEGDFQPGSQTAVSLSSNIRERHSSE